MASPKIVPVNSHPAVSAAARRLTTAKARFAEADAAYATAVAGRAAEVEKAALASLNGGASPALSDLSGLKDVVDIAQKAVELAQREHDDAVATARRELSASYHDAQKAFAAESVAAWGRLREVWVRSMKAYAAYNDAGMNSMEHNPLIPPAFGTAGQFGSEPVFDMMDNWWMKDLKTHGYIK